MAVVAGIRDEILEFLARSQATLAGRARARKERSGENTLQREQSVRRRKAEKNGDEVSRMAGAGVENEHEKPQ